MLSHDLYIDAVPGAPGLPALEQERAASAGEIEERRMLRVRVAFLVDQRRVLRDPGRRPSPGGNGVQSGVIAIDDRLAILTPGGPPKAVHPGDDHGRASLHRNSHQVARGERRAAGTRGISNRLIVGRPKRFVHPGGPGNGMGLFLVEVANPELA